MLRQTLLPREEPSLSRSDREARVCGSRAGLSCLRTLPPSVLCLRRPPRVHGLEVGRREGRSSGGSRGMGGGRELGNEWVRE